MEPSATEFVKLVLPYGTTEDEFTDFARLHGFEPTTRLAPKDRSTLLTVTYRHPSLDAPVQYVLNHIISIATARCYGTERDRVAQFARDYFFIVDEAEIRDCLNAPGPGDRGLGLAYLAEFAPARCDESLLGYFAAGARDIDKDVREFAYLAMACAGWPELLPLAREAEAAETDPMLAQQCQRLVTNLGSA